MKPSINREELRILRNKIINKCVSTNIELDSLGLDLDLNTNKTDIIDICQILKDVGFIIVDKDSDRELELLDKSTTIQIYKSNKHK